MIISIPVAMTPRASRRERETAGGEAETADITVSPVTDDADWRDKKDRSR
ncbi:hypothetical protein GCM10010246_62080 [Streptomyces cuspidosporus]|uniref:Uncharacterized protein n=1 Tax=Streptomyces cuspidosporus TaxID=66882 RepID=A0ABN3GX18_9ACTN